MDPHQAIKDQFRAFGLPPGPSSPNPIRRAGLELLERRRNDRSGPAVLRDERGESWACGVVAIPMQDYALHVANNPELNCKDRDTRNKAWHKFFRDFGRLYGVDDSIGKRQRADGIIVR